MSSVRKMIQLSEANVDAFFERFPEGSLSWALDMLLERFIAQYKMTAKEYADIAAEQLREEQE